MKQQAQAEAELRASRQAAAAAVPAWQPEGEQAAGGTVSGGWAAQAAAAPPAGPPCWPEGGHAVTSHGGPVTACDGQLCQQGHTGSAAGAPLAWTPPEMDRQQPGEEEVDELMQMLGIA
ncbi:hypothetical protein ACK3TF_005203 [Chlorella vulgaris]